MSLMLPITSMIDIMLLEPEPPVTDSWAQGIIPVVQMEKFPISDCIEGELELSEANSSIDEDFPRYGSLYFSLS